MEFDLTKIAAFCAAIMGVIAFIGQMKSFFSSGEKQLATEISDLKKAITDANAEARVHDANVTAKLTDHDRRIQSIEGEIKHMPDRDTSHRLELAMEKISGRLDTLDEKLKPIAATNERMNELLVEQARK